MPASEHIVPECPAAAAARRYGSRVALDSPGGEWTFSELDARVSMLAGVLRHREVTEGAPIGLLAVDGADSVCALLALIRIGAIAVPVSTRLPSMAISESLGAVGSNVLIYGSGTVAGAGEGFTGMPLRSLDELGEIDRRPDSTEAHVHLDTPCVAIFTSGTSGRPKAAALSLSAVLHSAVGSNRNIPLDVGDRWLLSIPMYHVGGLSILFRCLVAGATVVLPQPSDDVATCIAELRPTHLSIVPTQLRRLLAFPNMAAQPKSILVGGGPISGELLSASREAGARVFLTYGLTEMASQVSTTSDPSRLAGASDAGNVLPYRSVRIAGDGEILVRGETLFSGYLEGGSVQPATDADGWFHTRDVGWFTAEQHLVIRGRKDHMFVSGGENIHPEEIERAIERLPEVERAVVVDIPDEEYGARPVAFVSFRGRELRLDELRLRLDDLLPRFKHPVAVFPYPADEAGTLGKPARRSLREIARAKRRGHD